MIVCQKCKGEFPTNVKIGNVIKNLQHRKFCLSCSPFGKHNTRNLVGNVIGEVVVKECLRCKKILDSNRRNYCGGCKTTMQRRRKKKILVESKGGKCIKCGYNKCVDALTFHHRDPSVKEFQISLSMDKSIITLQKEIEKCDLICCNCHAEEHFSEF